MFMINLEKCRSHAWDGSKEKLGPTVGAAGGWGQSRLWRRRQTSLPVLPLIVSWVSLGGGGRGTCMIQGFGM